MIDNVKPRRRVRVSYTLLPEEIDALSWYAKRNGTTKSRAISKLLKGLKGYPERLRYNEEKYDHQDRIKQAKIDAAIRPIIEDIDNT